MTFDPRTDYATATREYDSAFEHAFADTIMEAIAKSCMVIDAPRMVIRTGEAAGALLTVLAIMIALSPSAARSPGAIRKAIEELGNASADEASEEIQDLLHSDVGGHA
jgi:hypothetical protein